MKRLKETLGTALCALLVCMGALWLSSCSKSGAEKVNDIVLEDDGGYVSSQNFLVIAGNAWSVYENLGCSLDGDEIELSNDVEKALSRALSKRELKMAEPFLEMEGIDPHKAFFILDMINDEFTGAFIFGLTDEDKFAELIEKVDFEGDGETDGYDVWTYRGVTVLVKDKVAYMVPGKDGKKAVKALAALKEKAKSDPLKPWQKELLSSEKTCVTLISFKAIDKLGHGELSDGLKRSALPGVNTKEILNGYLVGSGNVADSELTSEFSVVDEDGNTIKNPYMGTSVDTSLLKYASADNPVVTLAAIDGSQDWESLLRQTCRNADSWAYDQGYYEDVFRIAELVQDYVDGTVMAAAGINPNASVTRLGNEEYLMQQVRGVVAVQTKPGKAQEAFEFVLGKIREEGVPYSASSSSLTLEQNGITLRMKVQGNLMLVSLNQEIKTYDSCPVNASALQGANMAVGLDIEPGYPYLKMVGIKYGIEASLTMKDASCTLSISITGSDKPLLATILDLAMKF